MSDKIDTSAVIETATHNGLTRRQLVLAVASVAAPALLVGGAVPGQAQQSPMSDPAAPSGAKGLAFLALSKAITGHVDLDAGTANRIRSAMGRADAGFEAQATALAALLSPGLSPEALLSAAGDAGLRDVALALVAAWYTGTVGHGPKAVCVSYASALMYRPVSDGLPVPTFCSKGPLWWTEQPPEVGVAPPVEAAHGRPGVATPPPRAVTTPAKTNP